MENKFYVYVWYLDNIPVYVGKGCNKRAFRNPDVKVKIYQENLTEQEAFDLERTLISQYGRKDLNAGPLENLTNGGGIAFHDLYWVSDELKRRHKEGLEKRYSDLEWVEKHRERCKLVANKRSKNWQDSIYLVETPSGELIEFKTQELKTYCEENNISFSTLKAIARGEIESNKKHRKNFRHGGYKVAFIYNKTTKFRQTREEILKKWQR